MKIQRTLTLENELIMKALRSLDQQLAPQLGLPRLETNTAAFRAKIPFLSGRPTC